ncbi:low molecular weight phosphotyrosine protein phosphatase [Marinomonas agarivorans]|nr:low molecular weight phosphotyrosine protein phosphatase [Marinomonas agarivorans]
MSLKVLTVCLGNICRSPAAQGILQAKAAAKGLDIVLDSAGTAAYHLGKKPDTRSIAELRKRNIDISGQQARQIVQQDFNEFDWLLVMDKSNLKNVQAICPPEQQHKVRLFASFALNSSMQNDEVEDPYYGGDEGFAIMADHLEALADGFLETIL